MVLIALLLGSIGLNFILFFGIIAGAASKGSSGMRLDRGIRFTETELSSGTDETNKIAAIPLNGLIAFEVNGSSGRSMVVEFQAALRRAVEDESVKAILLVVNSGGGEVTASDELYAALKRAAEKKPVLVYLLAVGASGAYYTAVGGTEIMASDTCFTGSIGVILRTLNYEGLFDKVGLQSVTFKSGAFKDMLGGDRPMTPEEIAYVEAMVMEIYGKFVGIVAEERSIPLETLKNGVADGRILSGLDAKEAGLIDATGRLEDAYARVRELAGAAEAPIMQYQPEPGLGAFLRMLGRADTPTIEVQLPGFSAGSLEPGRFYLLPATFAHQP